MKNIVKIGYILLSLLFLIYLLIPSSGFPLPLNDALQSNEPADTETPLRRAYFTDLERRQVIDHYSVFFRNRFSPANLLLQNFNYPPEEAQILIRDQTRSTYLEELSYPFRESIYVNGFEPKIDKDKILIGDKYWQQKVIVRYVPSNVVSRLVVGIIAIILLPVLVNNWISAIKDLAKESKKIWIFR